MVCPKLKLFPIWPCTNHWNCTGTRFHRMYNSPSAQMYLAKHLRNLLALGLTHCRRGKIFLDPFRVPDRVWKLNWQRQITGEKHTSSIELFTCAREPSQENQDPKKLPWKEAFISFKQRNNEFVKNWKDKGSPKVRGYMCVYYLFCCIAETNTIL